MKNSAKNGCHLKIHVVFTHSCAYTRGICAHMCGCVCVCLSVFLFVCVQVSVCVEVLKEQPKFVIFAVKI